MTSTSQKPPAVTAHIARSRPSPRPFNPGAVTALDEVHARLASVVAYAETLATTDVERAQIRRLADGRDQEAS